MEHYPLGRHRQIFPAGSILEMPRYGFSLTVWVSGQKDLFGLVASLLDLSQEGLLVFHNNVRRLEVLVHVNANLTFWQVPDVSLGRSHNVLSAQDLSDGPRLGRGLYDHQAFTR